MIFLVLFEYYLSSIYLYVVQEQFSRIFILQANLNYIVVARDVLLWL